MFCLLELFPIFVFYQQKKSGLKSINSKVFYKAKTKGMSVEQVPKKYGSVTQKSGQLKIRTAKAVQMDM